MRILKLDELPWDKIPEKRRRVFLRVDFNVPLKSGKILDDYRIRQAVPTIKYLLERKCVVVLASHLGRPEKLEGDKKKSLSLLPIAEKLSAILDHEIIFSEECVGSGIRKLILDARPGKTVILRENLRFHEAEEKNDLGFAEKLFDQLDIYVNDAFGAAHRAHASIDAVARLARRRAMGLLLAKEWDVLNQVMHHPLTPQMAILGGSKIEDKIQVIDRLMGRCEQLCFGGRMGLSFVAAEGLNLGGTKIDAASIQLAKRLLGDAKSRDVKMNLPIDAWVGTSLEATEAKLVDLDHKTKLSADQLVLDIGPKTLEAWKLNLQKARSVVWNGPMGVFENPRFATGTLGVVDFLVDARDRIQAIAGGGETVSAITSRGALDKLYHVSTGGGAMLEFLEGKELPGFEALKLREREISDMHLGLPAF